MGSFSDDIARWADRVRERADDVCRIVALSLTTKVVMRSPVGNPELWAANAEAVRQREEHNVVVDRIVEYLKSDPRNLTAKGNLKRSVRSAQSKRLSKAELAKMYPLKTGKGYVGGRFRGNWQLTISARATAQLDRIDPSGNEAISAASAALAGFKAGPPIYIVNNLPYGQRLEYGWSTQAPNGMVRITVAEFADIVQDAVRATE